MPQWTDEAPQEDEQFAHRIIRCPATKPLCGTITSPTLVGTYTHFINNRTVPCDYPNPCDLDDQGFSRRWHGYVSLLVDRSLEHAIFEMTGKASDPLKNYARIHQTLRACSIRATRPSGKTNGRVLIEPKQIDEARYRLPEPFNVIQVLCHIWNVKYEDADLFTGRGPCFKTIGLIDSGDDGRYGRPTKP